MSDLPKMPGNLFSSRFARLVILMILTLVMLIPIGLVASVIAERGWYHSTAVREISQTWGGEVSIGAIAMVIPVERSWTERTKDDDGNQTTIARTGPGNPLILLPATLDATADLASSRRARGVFEVPVYDAAIELDFDFDTSEAGGDLPDNERLLWDQASLLVMLPNSRSFRGEAALTRAAETLRLEPGAPAGDLPGIQAALGDPRGKDGYALRMTLGGAQRFSLSPSARLTRLSLSSDWPHPSFSGDMLPRTRDISETGFTAQWDVPHLMRSVPQTMREPAILAQLAQTGFGVDFVEPVNFYLLAERAAKYGILFIALTFLTVFLTEGAARTPTHPAQFILIGLAQSVFFLLLIALSEQIGFALAYLAAAAATVTLLSYYGFAALRLGRGGWMLTLTLALLYGTMFLIVKSEDYALLAGSILAFATVAVTMVKTRNEDWRRKPVPA